MTPTSIKPGPALLPPSLFRAIICLIRLPGAACVIPHTAFSPSNATSENERAKRATSVTSLRCDVSPAASYIRLKGTISRSVCVTPEKSMKMDFAVNVYKFLLFFFYHLRRNSMSRIYYGVSITMLKQFGQLQQ